MSIRLALELSNKIAAVAPVVAAKPAVSCNDPVLPISILFLLGTDDPLSPFQGGEVAPTIGARGTVLSAQESLDFWREVNKTDANPIVTNFSDISDGDSSTMCKVLYDNGKRETQVILYEVKGGGHLEPSIQEQYAGIIEVSLGKQNHDIEMAREIWNFLRDKTLN